MIKNQSKNFVIIKKAKLCRNLIWIAGQINGVALPIVHCRKGTGDNDNMDDFLGTSIVADAAATRIKLYRKSENEVNMYAKTRYAERPEKVSLRWKYPLLEVTPTVLKPREEAKKAILEFLQSNGQTDYKVTELTRIIAQEINHNEKTVRAALNNLELEGEITISRLPKSAIKVLKLAADDKIYAS